MREMLLAPGRALMARLNYVQRFTLIGLLTLPLVVMVGIGVAEIHRDARLAEKEAIGSEFTEPLLHILHLLHHHRPANRSKRDRENQDLGRLRPERIHPDGRRA